MQIKNSLGTKGSSMVSLNLDGVHWLSDPIVTKDAFALQ